MLGCKLPTNVHKMSQLNRITGTNLRLKSTPVSHTTASNHKQIPQAGVEIPFARAKIGNFFQAQPVLGNQFLEDTTLQKYLRRHMSDKIVGEIFLDLEQFGERVRATINDLNRECELNPPRVEQFDAWGKRTDKLITSSAWKQMKQISAEEGLIAIAYERKYGEFSRLYQLAKLFLFALPSGGYYCPLAMTDGAAKTIEVIGKTGLLGKAYNRLISRDPNQFWTSGQWMTERKGGSDVANGTQTLAVEQEDKSYKLYGYKWFSSATDSDIALTLARTCDQNGQFVEGTRGLSMFYLEVRDAHGSLNNIEIQRLKEKLGTRAVPTAELLLDGSKAFKVSDEGRGVASITNLLTLTRIHNSLQSAASMRRIVNMARDYGTKRECFGKTINKHPLHVKHLANMEIECRAATLLVLELGRLLGLDDCQQLSHVDADMFRLLTPIAKLYTAKQAVAVVSEGLECFGGIGYLEDSGLPMLLRDSQVLPIWEGTTNILALDVLRALKKSDGSILTTFSNEVHRRVTIIKKKEIKDLYVSLDKVESSMQHTLEFANKNTGELELAAREFAFSLARIYMGLLLLEHATWISSSADDIVAANRWCQQDLSPIFFQSQYGNYGEDVCNVETQLVYAGYQPTNKL